MSAPASFGRPKDGRIPALSLRQPWAWAILHAGKRIENRLAWRSCTYRGPIILHASAWPKGKLDADGTLRTRRFPAFEEAAWAMFDAIDPSDRIRLGPVTMGKLLERRGGVVGCARIVDAVSGSLEFDTKIRMGTISLRQKPWYMGGFALVLDDVKPLPFIPCGGALGLFGLAPSVYEQVIAAEPSLARSVSDTWSIATA